MVLGTTLSSSGSTVNLVDSVSRFCAVQRGALCRMCPVSLPLGESGRESAADYRPAKVCVQNTPSNQLASRLHRSEDAVRCAEKKGAPNTRPLHRPPPRGDQNSARPDAPMRG